ncbi:MAG: galactose oxidase [Ponticaulis sp.]|nr:galactose oxidase [Ponticaulis sp.]|tara:strand:- start:14601 stop:15605 length:1005 start_codon:yes stop_codon:yes gene_type:complete
MNRREWLLMMGSTALAACTARTGLSDTGTPLDWSVVASLPRPKQEIYPALHNGEIWLSGGFVAENGAIIGPTNETVIYNPETDSWRDGPGIPTPRHHPHLHSHEGKLYALGGFEAVAADAQWEMQKTGWRLDEDGWNVIPAAPGPIGEAVTASLSTGLHVVGGRSPRGAANRVWTDHTDTGQHFVFANGAWDSAAPLPTPRNSATAEVIDGNLHVVGGRTVEGGNSTSHDVYSPQSDRWFMRRPLPQGQGGLASGVIDGKLYAFGGEFFDNGGGVYPQCWVYDPEADSWEAGPDMRSPRHGLGGITLNNRIYAIGGALKRGGSETSAAVEVLGV